MDCQDLVELVTDYLDGALSEPDRVRFETHLTTCPGCVNYVEQMRTTARLAGRVRPDDLGREMRERLLGAFRDWKSGQPS